MEIVTLLFSLVAIGYAFRANQLARSANATAQEAFDQSEKDRYRPLIREIESEIRDSVHSITSLPSYDRNSDVITTGAVNINEPLLPIDLQNALKTWRYLANEAHHRELRPVTFQALKDHGVILIEIVDKYLY